MAMTSMTQGGLGLKHGASLYCTQPSTFVIKDAFRSLTSYLHLHRLPSRSCRRATLITCASFANENREFVIVGGGNAAGYAARTFVENGMADGKLCIVSKESVAPYERPALTKAYLFPLDKKPARLPGFHTCVGSGGERQTPEWYKDKGIEVMYGTTVTGLDISTQTLTTASGSHLKYGSLIIATGCTASRLPDSIGGNLPGVHYIRDVADADLLVSSMQSAKKTCYNWRWLHWHGGCGCCCWLEA